MGSGRGAGGQREDLPFLGKRAAADVLDSGDHATGAGEHLIAESHQPAVGIGGGETHGAALSPGRSRRASGLSAQSVMKAAAVERLMPAQQ